MDIEFVKINEIPTEEIEIFDMKILYLLKESINKFGQVKPIVINNENKIVDGRKILKVMTELKYDRIAVIRVDVDQNAFRLFKIILNNVFGRQNHITLANELKQLLDHYSKNELMKFLPFSKDSIEQIDAILKYDWDETRRRRNNISANQETLF